MSAPRSGCSRPGSASFAPRSTSWRLGSAPPGSRSRYPDPGPGGSLRGLDDADRGLDGSEICWKWGVLAAGPRDGAARAVLGRKEGQEAVGRPPSCYVSCQRAPRPLALDCGSVEASWSLRRSRPERWAEADVSALDVSPSGSVEEISGRAADRALQLFDNRFTTYLPPEPACRLVRLRRMFTARV